MDVVVIEDGEGGVVEGEEGEGGGIDELCSRMVLISTQNGD